ncbi:hypothetical protein [uncultured Desulfobacter sp.]|uniref:hypothetical protein n=1 Tax=uncultured Desulfobacter sp. TaxID=240139 RepID=UPI002AAAF5D0|nr:hypothetical protein [uncultured Desulfobacter sp.]
MTKFEKNEPTTVEQEFKLHFMPQERLVDVPSEKPDDGVAKKQHCLKKLSSMKLSYQI